MLRLFNFVIFFLALAKPTIQATTDDPLNDDADLPKAQVVVFVDFDDFASEIYFAIKDTVTHKAVLYQPYGTFEDSQNSVTIAVDLVLGRKYTFIIKDQAGDGMMNPSGSYSVTQNGQVLVSGDGSFEALRETNFTVQIPPTLSPPPTIPPTSRITPAPTGAPAPAPSTGATDVPSDVPSLFPSLIPSDSPSMVPSHLPSLFTSTIPSDSPSMVPSHLPSDIPSDLPSTAPSQSIAPAASTDSLAPTQIPGEILPAASASTVEVVVFINFDDNPEEIRWSIQDISTFELVETSYVPYPATQDTTSETVTLITGKNYYFTIEDVAGNGMTNPFGSFTLTQGDIELLSGDGDFEDFASYEFTTL